TCAVHSDSASDANTTATFHPHSDRCPCAALLRSSIAEIPACEMSGSSSPAMARDKQKISAKPAPLQQATSSPTSPGDTRPTIPKSAETTAVPGCSAPPLPKAIQTLPTT